MKTEFGAMKVVMMINILIPNMRFILILLRRMIMLNIGQIINKEIKDMGNKFCEDICPYKHIVASYDEEYEPPCSINRCYVEQFIKFLTFEVENRK